MAMNWTLKLDDHRPEVFENAGELRQRLLDVHEQAKPKPFFALLNAPDGSSLAVGLGRELSVLSFAAPGGWPGRHVLGDEKNEGTLEFDFVGHYTEVPARYAIPILDAVQAAVGFFSTGKFSEELQWEDD